MDIKIRVVGNNCFDGLAKNKIEEQNPEMSSIEIFVVFFLLKTVS